MYRHQQGLDASAGAEHSGYLSASTITSSFSQTQFPSPLFSVDPRLPNNSQHLHPGSQHTSAISPAREPRALAASDVIQPSSSISARLTKSPPPSQTTTAPPKPTVRALPTKSVTPESITAAYVDFVLFCNPNFPLDVDTTTLKSNFQSPPKSDNKDFEVFRLFELIKKFDAKEIKTWGQLALDLGVEAPDVSKGQSVQKVQQYSVRLKRWMRAMHIDAFFEYLLGKPHAYFTDVPTANDPYPAGGRDGVAAEEDLAIRALDPSFRPKRGRRRNSDTEQDDSSDGPANKHSRMEPQSAVVHSAMPLSAHPDHYSDPWATAGYNSWLEKSNIPQSAVSTTAPSHVRWQLHGAAPNEPATPHPMTAVSTSMTAHIDRAFDQEPRSAITSSVKRKRKHGPAVSSAWPSSTAPGTKPRGRPPTGRSVQDGPFNTFPVEPANSNPSTNGARSMGPPDEVTGPPILPPPISRQTDGPGRPGRLSLQVPPHMGGPVRLATPPPRVVVNGETNSSEGRSETQTPIIDSRPHHASFPTRPHYPNNSNNNNNNNPSYQHIQIKDRDVPGFAFEVLKRVLTSDLLRAEVVGRPTRLTSDEAKSLANAILDRLGVPRRDTHDSRDDISRLTAASWLGLGDQLNVPLGPATSAGKKVAVTRFRRDADGYEEIVCAADPTAPGETRDIFDMSWTVALGGCQGNFELKGLTVDGVEPEAEPIDVIQKKALDFFNIIHRPPTSEEEWVKVIRQCSVEGEDVRGLLNTIDENVDWKSRALSLEFSGRVVQGEMKRTKTRLLESILEILQ